MSTYYNRRATAVVLAEAGMLDAGTAIDEAGIEQEELSQPSPSQRVKTISRLTSSYMVEIRKLLTSTKYILRIVKRDQREVNI